MRPARLVRADLVHRVLIYEAVRIDALDWLSLVAEQVRVAYADLQLPLPSGETLFEDWIIGSGLPVDNLRYADRFAKARLEFVKEINNHDKEP